MTEPPKSSKDIEDIEGIKDNSLVAWQLLLILFGFFIILFLTVVFYSTLGEMKIFKKHFRRRKRAF